MSLLDDIEAERTLKGPRCSIAVLLERLAPDDAEGLRAKLAEPPEVITHAAIGRVLRKRGHWMQDSTISRHRRRQCGCDL